MPTRRCSAPRRLACAGIVLTVLVLPACRAAAPAPSSVAAGPSSAPPAGLSPSSVPMFVVVGSDDNGASGIAGSGAAGGMHFLTDLFAGRRNPAGAGHAATFDGAPAHFSFYVNTYYVEPETGATAYSARGHDDPVWVLRSWHEAIVAGHEIGVHTHSHPHGRDFTAARWRAEMERCIAILVRPYLAGEGAGPRPGGGVGVQRSDLPGFRTPYLEYGDATLTAAAGTGFVYDCSLEEGTAAEIDGRRYVWPYRLDHGSPGNPDIRSHPGLWEVPVYAFVVPPDEACDRLGVAPGLRSALKTRNDYFDLAGGKITGMDWNLWCEYGMTPAEFLATVRYTLELRLAGNRCPLTLGIHSELYSDRQEDAECPTPVAQRRAALAALIDDLFRNDVIRVVSARELVTWLEHPAPL
jgi:peptidoglycan/xylan/chitin deacetylase (PgdA/CDA1 family)